MYNQVLPIQTVSQGKRRVHDGENSPRQKRVDRQDGVRDGLHNWFIISKYAETKQTRVNFKKLGCLFEAFLGALFLDFNKITVKDEHGWFENVFMVGPGFQMAQVFVEAIFERHVNWIELILTDDNYKNILQVKIQKEFKITPDYIEMGAGSGENGTRWACFSVWDKKYTPLNTRTLCP
jgi:hypothetical protein